jgi:hypothetical protein
VKHSLCSAEPLSISAQTQHGARIVLEAVKRADEMAVRDALSRRREAAAARAAEVAKSLKSWVLQKNFLFLRGTRDGG